MIICNVFSDHPVRLNPTYWVIKIPNRRSHVPFFLLQGLVLCSGHCSYSLGKEAADTADTRRPSHHVLRLYIVTMRGQYWRSQTRKALRGRELEDYTPVTSQPIYLAERGGGMENEKNIYIWKRETDFSNLGGDSICVKITHLHTNLFSFFFIPGVRRNPERRCFDAVNSMWGSRFLSIDTAAHYGWSVVCRQKSLFSLLPVLLISSQGPLSLIILRASPQHWLSRYLTVDFHVLF